MTVDAETQAPPFDARRQVRAFGRVWPRAFGVERFFWLASGLCCIAVLAVAVWLRPDPSGMGTHTQLGLPPCGFVEMFDIPCPSCGFTTTFALAAHGRVIDAIRNQPFGFVIFLMTIGAAPLSLVAGARGVSLFELTERWPWGRLMVGFIALWLLAWAYKWLVFVP